MGKNSDNEGKIGYFSITAIGVGGMVGGGIFAVLGLAVKLAHGGTPAAFLLAGLVLGSLKKDWITFQ
jgi:amino acid transporter